MKYHCNPMNLPYKYQFLEGNKAKVFREAADPSLVLFKGRYYLFPSMAGGFYAGDNLVDWSFYPLPSNIPVYDYAPDVRVLGEYLYFSASKMQSPCSFFRTRDPIEGRFEEIKGAFPFWDPNLFVDDDGRVYFYWGSSNSAPIYGIELDSVTMLPVGEKRELIFGDGTIKGYERPGDNHVPPKTPEMIEAAALEIAKKYMGVTEMNQLPQDQQEMLYQVAGNGPYIEGSWMTKHGSTYYLQYAFSGTEYNVYGDGCYVSDAPLGPFKPARNNPFSYKPGGFITGAGHGSLLEDKNGKWWHISSMRISRNHQFERRIGFWQAGFDQDGELFCDQRYGDWPARLDQKPWDKPEWMLLSYGKAVKVSSGEGADNVTDEDIRTWWKAADSHAGQWVEVDLGRPYDVRAIQINFADSALYPIVPDGMEFFGEMDRRRIDDGTRFTRWLLEGSPDGEKYYILQDKTTADTDLPHDLIVLENGAGYRFIKLTIYELPFDQAACVSGIRVFGKAEGSLPKQANEVRIELLSDVDMLIRWGEDDATGHNILWGYAEDKLYHSCMVFGKSEQIIGALVKGTPLYVRVDTFNECGITEGSTVKII